MVMKKNSELLKSGYKYMSDGEQLFNSATVKAMDKIRLWDNLIHSYMYEKDGIKYYISVGWNGSYFKTDGQIYCTHLHIEKDDKCYLESCLCSWKQNEIPNDIKIYQDQVQKFIQEGIDFDSKFDKAIKNYPWQTSI